MAVMADELTKRKVVRTLVLEFDLVGELPDDFDIEDLSPTLRKAAEIADQAILRFTVMEDGERVLKCRKGALR